jgi:hypothetical protein
MGKWVHRLSNFNEVTKMADCLTCGRIEVYVRPDGKRHCRTAMSTRRIAARHGVAVPIKGIPSRPSTCSLCDTSVALVFDHCHTSGEFRGWICNDCNLALGLVRDKTETLKRMVSYLERN